MREMVRRSPSATGSSRDDAFVLARQENLETIHRHNVVAERYGLLSEIRAELDSGEHSPHHTTMREWLEAPAALSLPWRPSSALARASRSAARSRRSSPRR